MCSWEQVQLLLHSLIYLQTVPVKRPWKRCQFLSRTNHKLPKQKLTKLSCLLKRCPGSVSRFRLYCFRTGALLVPSGQFKEKLHLRFLIISQLAKQPLQFLLTNQQAAQNLSRSSVAFWMKSWIWKKRMKNRCRGIWMNSSSKK